MYKLKYFTEAEMRITKDTPENIRLNALNIAEKIMDPLREFIKKPVLINSWYRSPEYNKKVGGAKNSQHTTGEAVDFIVKGMSIEEIYAIIMRMGLVFDQIILEYGNGTTWVHISLKRVGTNRKEKLKAIKTNGKWNYTPIK